MCVNALKVNEDGFASGGAIIADVDRVSRLCRVLSFSFVKRDGKYVCPRVCENC